MKILVFYKKKSNVVKMHTQFASFDTHVAFYEDQSIKKNVLKFSWIWLDKVNF